jgi:hypothetical protein
MLGLWRRRVPLRAVVERRVCNASDNVEVHQQAEYDPLRFKNHVNHFRAMHEYK